MNFLLSHPTALLFLAGAAVLLLMSQGVIGTLLGALVPGANLYRETILGNMESVQVGLFPPQTGTASTSSNAWGLGFPKTSTGANAGLGYIGFIEIPTGSTMTTGITLYLCTTDDGSFSSDLGNTVVFGVSCRLVTAANTTNTYGTATEHTITMAATTGVMVKTAFAITNANMNSAAAGDFIQIRVYRKGASASDLCFGRILAVPYIPIEDT